MNYGYSNGHEIELEEKDKKNRYSAQLYDYVTRDINTKGKDILEVGCGRGGGLSYVNRRYSPNSATGLDCNKKAIEFCKKFYAHEKLNFQHGNAQELDFEDDSFDVVINVESSHRYLKMQKFVHEIYRVLKVGGIFVFTDFRPRGELSKLDNQLKKPNFVSLKYEVITSNILEALKLSSEERELLVRKISPKILNGLGRRFAATEGTPTFKKFKTNEFEYVFYILRKLV